MVLHKIARATSTEIAEFEADRQNAANAEKHRQEVLASETAAADSIAAKKAEAQAIAKRKRAEADDALATRCPWFGTALIAINKALLLAQTMKQQGAPGSARMLTSLAKQFRSTLGDVQLDTSCLSKLDLTVKSVCWMLQARSMSSEAERSSSLTTSCLPTWPEQPMSSNHSVVYLFAYYTLAISVLAFCASQLAQLLDRSSQHEEIGHESRATS